MASQVRDGRLDSCVKEQKYQSVAAVAGRIIREMPLQSMHNPVGYRMLSEPNSNHAVTMGVVWLWLTWVLDYTVVNECT